MCLTIRYRTVIVLAAGAFACRATSVTLHVHIHTDREHHPCARSHADANRDTVVDMRDFAASAVTGSAPSSQNDPSTDLCARGTEDTMRRGETEKRAIDVATMDASVKKLKATAISS